MYVCPGWWVSSGEKSTNSDLSADRVIIGGWAPGMSPKLAGMPPANIFTGRKKYIHMDKNKFT